RKQMEDLLQDMKKQGVITPSTSPWASPVVLVPKQDGSIRFCVDYRKVNAVTRKDCYHLLRIDELLDSLNGAKYFSSLDLQSGYWQINMSEEDKSKTAFITHKGTFQFNKMPFGLTNAPATFQRLMDCVLSGLTGLICLVFLDDIIIYTRTTAMDHLRHVMRILWTLKDAGLKVKGRKCKIARKEIKFLGHIVSAKGIAPDPEKVQAVQDATRPTDRKGVRQFLGLVNFYRKFIKNCAAVSAAMNNLLKQDRVFKWTLSCQESFDKLKHMLCKAPVLAYPDFTKPFLLYTDASGDGIGSVLAQKDSDGKEHVIAYSSRSLNSYERNYGISELEM
ncbi:MAG: RNA-directed DNA polymerase, partial [Candidatus Omnitrophica bacterium]|nr:RNA-directed DNA polymerase [Candidatus Omnitrophota bacterium]